MSGMSDYYDRAGLPMDADAWIAKFGDFDYKVVAKDTVGDVEVSTVWLGLNHGVGGGPPLIFETMIFGGPDDQYCDRYSTEAEAIAGHGEILRRVTEGVSA